MMLLALALPCQHWDILPCLVLIYFCLVAGERCGGLEGLWKQEQAMFSFLVTEQGFRQWVALWCWGFIRKAGDSCTGFGSILSSCHVSPDKNRNSPGLILGLH